MHKLKIVLLSSNCKRSPDHISAISEMVFCNVIGFHYFSVLYISIPMKTVHNWHQMLSSKLLLSCRLYMLFLYDAVLVRLAPFYMFFYLVILLP